MVTAAAVEVLEVASVVVKNWTVVAVEITDSEEAAAVAVVGAGVNFTASTCVIMVSVDVCRVYLTTGVFNTFG